MITRADMEHDVALTVRDYIADYDVPGIVTALIAEYGVIDVESVPGDEYWSIVADYDVTEGLITVAEKS